MLEIGRWGVGIDLVCVFESLCVYNMVFDFEVVDLCEGAGRKRLSMDSLMIVVEVPYVPWLASAIGEDLERSLAMEFWVTNRLRVGRRLLDQATI